MLAPSMRCKFLKAYALFHCISVTIYSGNDIVTGQVCTDAMRGQTGYRPQAPAKRSSLPEHRDLSRPASH